MQEHLTADLSKTRISVWAIRRLNLSFSSHHFNHNHRLLSNFPSSQMKVFIISAALTVLVTSASARSVEARTVSDAKFTLSGQSDSGGYPSYTLSIPENNKAVRISMSFDYPLNPIEGWSMAEIDIGD